MDGVGTPIIGRPRPLPGHDTPNPANNTYTLNYEEPDYLRAGNQSPIPFDILGLKDDYEVISWESITNPL